VRKIRNLLPFIVIKFVDIIFQKENFILYELIIPAAFGDRRCDLHISIKKKLEFYISDAVIYTSKQANHVWHYENKFTSSETFKYLLIYKALATMGKVTQVKIRSQRKTRSLDKVVMKWYVQQHACGMTVWSVEIKFTADTVASVCKFHLKQAMTDIGNFQRDVATKIAAQSMKLLAWLPKR